MEGKFQYLVTLFFSIEEIVERLESASPLYGMTLYVLYGIKCSPCPAVYCFWCFLKAKEVWIKCRNAIYLLYYSTSILLNLEKKKGHYQHDSKHHPSSTRRVGGVQSKGKARFWPPPLCCHYMLSGGRKGGASIGKSIKHLGMAPLYKSALFSKVLRNYSSRNNTMSLFTTEGCYRNIKENLNTSLKGGSL